MILSEGCRKILHQMLKSRIIGGKHWPETLCLKYIRNYSKDEHRQAIKDWDWCIKTGWVILKPKPSDLHVSLNPERLQEIKQVLEEYTHG